jgi:hypothetical protein
LSIFVKIVDYSQKLPKTDKQASGQNQSKLISNVENRWKMLKLGQKVVEMVDLSKH